MTSLPSTPSRETAATGVVTNGVGKTTTAHLNLERSLADVMSLSGRRVWERDVLADQKIPFAGKE